MALLQWCTPSEHCKRIGPAAITALTSPAQVAGTGRRTRLPQLELIVGRLFALNPPTFRPRTISPMQDELIVRHHAGWAAPGPNAVRNRSRNASIGHTGAPWPGRSPVSQFQPDTRSRTPLSFA